MMRRVMICLAVAVSSGMLAVFMASMPVVQTHSISGEIEVEGRLSNEGVIVWVDSLHMTKTAPGSNYEIDGLDNGVYIVRAWSDHCLAVVVGTVHISGEDKIGVNGSLFTGDFVQDGRINLHDAGVMLGHFLETPDSSQWNSILDLNGDQVIDSVDIAILINHWKESSDSPLPRWGIVVMEPGTSSIWFLGQRNVAVRWIAGLYEGNPSISLHKSGVLIDTLSAIFTANDGHCIIPEVPPDLSVGDNYQVEVYYDEDHYAFSEHFSIEDVVIIINEPNSQTEWYIGQPNVSIEWTTGGFDGNLSIYLSLDGTPVDTVAMSTENDGIFEGYDIPTDLTPSGGYRIVLSREGGYDYFSEVFSIRQAIVVYNPDSNTVWVPGTEFGTIQWWDRAGLDGRVSLYLYRDDAEVDTIAYLIPNEYHSHFYHYHVPADMPFGPGYRILLVHEEGYFDYSDYFSLEDGIIINEPNGQTEWYVGQQNVSIEWSTGGFNGNLSIYLYLDGTPVDTVAMSTENDGIFEGYDVPEDLTPSGGYQIVLSREGGRDYFSEAFGIRQAIIIYKPDSNTVWPPGTELGTVQWWDRAGLDGRVSLYLYRGDVEVDTIAYLIPNEYQSHFYHYPVPSDMLFGSDYRILLVHEEGYFDYSDYFDIREPIKVTNPKYATVWIAGQDNALVSWTTVGLGGSVSIELYRGSTHVETIVSETPNDGCYDEYTVPYGLTPADDYRVLVYYDERFNDFSISFDIEEEEEPPPTSGWVQQSPYPKSLRSVSFPDGNTGTAVGYRGAIVRTVDGGKHWIEQDSGTKNILWDVCFTSADTGTAVGNCTTILRTTDGGTTWTKQRSGSCGDLFGVSFTDANNGTAVGAEGLIIRTIDGGDTWLEQTSGTAHELLDVSFVDAGTGWAVGKSGIVLHTTNGGETWNTQESGIAWTLHAVSFTDGNTGTIAGSKYFDEGSFGFWILRTTDGGDSWNLHKRGYTYLYDVSFIDENTGLAAGIPPHFGQTVNTDILWTVDGGTTWEHQDSGTRHYIYGVLMIDGNTAAAVGYWDKFDIRHGIILRTEDAGNTWLSQTGTMENLWGADCLDAGTAVVVGYNGVILRTDDGGTSWRQQDSGTGAHLLAVAFADADTGMTVGDGGTILSTFDGGVTWIPRSSGATARLYGLSFIDRNNITVVGENGGILRTTDGGSTWAGQTSGTTETLRSVSFSGPDDGTIAGTGGTILGTNDGGVTWVTQTSGTSEPLYSVEFFDISNGIAVGDAGTILRTTDGGETWIAQASGTGKTLISVSLAGPDTATVVGQDGTILRTVDGGGTWAFQQCGTDEDLRSISLLNAGVGVIAGYNGTILWTTTGGVQ